MRKFHGEISGIRDFQKNSFEQSIKCISFRNLASDDDYYYDYNLGGDDYYDDVYYDGLGNKKKKKNNKNSYNKPKPPSSSFPVPNSIPSAYYGSPTQPESGPHYGGVYPGSSINAPAGHTQSHAPAPGVSNNWFGSVNTVDTWTPLSWQEGKGQTTTWTTNLSPLIGNGRFCWNCYAIADAYGDAYYNCFNDGKGKNFTIHTFLQHFID